MEVGGILGGENNIITEFEFDEGTALTSKQHYYPNIEKLNIYLESWQEDNIQFYGIAHSHFQDERGLSPGDIDYIHAIMSAMPSYIDFLYFPIILPQREMVSFKAVRAKNGVNIVNDDIKILKKGGKSDETGN